MSTRITEADPRYRAVVDKQFNKRFTARPDYVRIVSSTDEVVSGVDDAVREGRRLVATSGGHCLEGLVSDPDARVPLTDDVGRLRRAAHEWAVGNLVRAALLIVAFLSVLQAFAGLVARSAS